MQASMSRFDVHKVTNVSTGKSHVVATVDAESFEDAQQMAGRIVGDFQTFRVVQRPDETDTTFNGWTNYETWNVKLWIDNDQGLYELVREQTLEIVGHAANHSNVPAIWTEQEAARFMLADWLKDELCEPGGEYGLVPDLGATMASDLLGAALEEVNWTEIAENLIASQD